MATFPNDQFDQVPDNLERVGAHRGPKVKGRGWIGFLWALLAVVVLVAAGIFVLQTIDGQLNFTGTIPEASDTPSPTPTTPAIVPVTDGSTVKARHITVTVLNGTLTQGLATKASEVLKNSHWTVSSVADASESNIKKTVVYYGTGTNKDVALGIAKLLGKSDVLLTSAFPGTPITVVLGSDYAG